MKKNQLILITLLLASVAIICLSGCIKRNPATAPDPVTGAPPPAYVVDPRINSASNTVTGVATFVAPFNPYAGVTEPLIKAGFAVAGVVGGWLAQRKNTTTAKNEASEKSKLLTTVIQGVEDAGTQSNVVKTAIQQRATAAGVQSKLDEVVQRVT